MGLANLLGLKYLELWSTQLSNNYKVEKGDVQRKRKKSHAMSRDSKNCEIMERCSIEKTLLIEQYWVKSHDQIIWKDNRLKINKVDDR